MNLPFSVLNNKKNKEFKIQEKKYDNSEKVTSIDFDKNLGEMVKLNLKILNPSDINFVRDNIGHFYRNNLMILFLTLNIRFRNDFISDENYNLYITEISRGVISVDKMAEFNEKLNKELNVYNTKIENILNNL